MIAALFAAPTDSVRRTRLLALIAKAKAKFRAWAERLRERLAEKGGLADAVPPVSTFASFALGDPISRWRARMAKGVRSLMLAASVALGANKADAQDRNAVSSAVAVQVGYLDKFANEIRTGVQPPNGTLVSRSALYADAAWGVAEGVIRQRASRDGATFEKRVLAEESVHCEECPALAALGWQPIGTLPPIGSTPCMALCRCRFEFAEGNPLEDIKMSKDSGESSAADSDDATVPTDSVVDDSSDIETESVAFDGPVAVTQSGDEMVVRKGLIFRFGNYPDKNYSLTPEQFATANPDFAGAPIDLSHTDTVLDGKMGELSAVEVKGNELHGTARLPRWLDSLLDSDARKVSCHFDRATNKLKRLSLVPNPRITDAALMAAFASAHKTPHGQSHIQRIHDMAAESGALCDAENSDGRGQVMYTAARERSGLQKIHDTAVEHGATCRVMKGGDKSKSGPMFHQKGPRVGSKGKSSMFKNLKSWVAFMRSKESENLSDEEIGEGLVAFAGAPTDADNKPTLTPEAVAEAAKVAAEKAVKDASTANPPPANFAESAEFKAVVAENKRMADDLATMRADKLRAKATAWADGLISPGTRRATPAQRDTLIAVFEQAARDDELASASVTFGTAEGAPKTGSRLDALVALFALAPTDTERFQAALEGRAVFGMDSVGTSANPEHRPPNPENVKRLMAMSGVVDN